MSEQPHNAGEDDAVMPQRLPVTRDHSGDAAEMVVTLRPRVLTIDAAQAYLCLGRTKVFELIGAGRLEAKRNFLRTVITVESCDAYIDGLESWKDKRR